jgi:acetyl-CoA C-acetyltransferase
MTRLAPNTPVIVGVGFRQEKSADPHACPEPYQLMVDAIRDAADDAGSSELLTALESISVQQGMWQYANPGKLIGDAVGCPDAKSILADLGVLQLTPLFDLCQAIVDGEQQLGVVTGGEAKFRDLRSKITGSPVTNTQQPEDTPAPDQHLASADPFATDVEAQQGIFLPTELFAVIESSLRHHKGLGIEQHRDDVAQLYSGFSEIASRNPRAWKQEVVPADEIRNPVGKNAMLAFPYTKRHNSQWNVNQAVAIIVCSAAKAEELGLDSSQWIYPVAAAQSRHVVCLAQQQTLHSHPGTVIAGQRAYEMAGITSNDISVADLYSCFPAAVQSFALDLGLEGVCPWSVTGSMAFAGGPFNHGALDGVARMVEVLRSGESPLPASATDAQESRTGLVSNLSGIFGKQGVALFSNQPNANGFQFEDVTEQVASEDIPKPITGDYVGPATVVGYTVSFNKQDITQGFAYCDTPEGERTVVKSLDKALLERMTREEFVGQNIEIADDRSFSLGA